MGEHKKNNPAGSPIFIHKINKSAAVKFKKIKKFNLGGKKNE